jgi:hypothetical protein
VPRECSPSSPRFRAETNSLLRGCKQQYAVELGIDGNHA